MYIKQNCDDQDKLATKSVDKLDIATSRRSNLEMQQKFSRSSLKPGITIVDKDNLNSLERQLAQ